MLDYYPGWQDGFLWVAVVGFLIAFVLAFSMGANDCANSYGTVVGSGVLKLWQAYVLATFFEILGAGLLGYEVTNTMRKSIVNVDIYSVYSQRTENGTYETVDNCTDLAVAKNLSCTEYTGADFMLGELGALAGTSAWLLLATVFHMPVSTTHSAVGATVGFSLVMKGSRGINWWTMVNIIISWIASPGLAGIISVLFYTVIKYTVFHRRDPLASALRMLPIFLWFALTINLFSVFFRGSKYLGLDKLPWWIDLLLSFFIGLIVAIAVWFFATERIRRRALRRALVDCPERGPVTNGAEEAVDLVEMQPSATVVVVEQATGGEGDHSAASSLSDCESGLDSGVYLTPKTLPATPLPRSKAGEGVVAQNGNLHSLAEMDEIKETAELQTPSHQQPSSAFDARSLKEKLKALKHPVEENRQASEVFWILQIISACFLSFSHGSNDTANAVGPLVGLWLTYKEGRATSDTRDDDGILEYIILFGAASMIIGLWCLGHRVMKTIGTKITLVTPASGFSMELGTAFTVLVASKIGIPVSTTHCMVGAVVCVGWIKSYGEKGVSWKVFRNILLAWVVTVPVAGAIAALITFLLGNFVL